MSSLPDWMYPPREEGWYAEDLDRLTEAPRHTELIDGALVFMMSPQRVWHSRVVTGLTFALAAQAPEHLEVYREMTIRLDRRNRPEPDLLVADVQIDLDRTWFDPSEVVLVIEVVSPESEHRDRTVKPRKYAEAGIPHYWRIEREDGEIVAHVHELDQDTGAYGPVLVCRGRLELEAPFPVKVDLNGLPRRQGRGN